MKIRVTGRYGHLSRGKTCAKNQETGKWAIREGASVIIEEPGAWMLHTSDGFNRKATTYVTISESGEVKGGDLRKFKVEMIE